MQKIEVNQKEYNVPISWDEVTYKQAVEVLVNVSDKAKQLNALSGIPLADIDEMTDSDATVLFTLISFTESLEVFNNDNVLEEHKDFDFGSIKYSSAEKCRSLMNTDSNGFICVIDLIKELKGIDITNEPFLKVIGTANFFLSNSIISMITTPSLTKVKKLLSNYKLESKDYKALEALERTLNSQKLAY